MFDKIKKRRKEIKNFEDYIIEWLSDDVISKESIIKIGNKYKSTYVNTWRGYKFIFNNNKITQKEYEESKDTRLEIALSNLIDLIDLI